jgi:hypothetical protein
MDYKLGSDLFGSKRFILNTKTKTTERGEMLKLFAQKTNRTIGFIAFKLTGIPTEDLYHIDSVCSKYNGPYSKCFFGSLKTRPVDNPLQENK